MMRIAIAEDDILFAETVKARIDDFFTARGEPARVWYGSSQAMLALLETRQNFDIYLFDVIMPEIMLMYGKEASNRKQEIDCQHHTIPNQRNQRPKDKHCGNVHNRLWNHG